MDVDESETRAAVSPTASLSASVTAVALFEEQSQPLQPFVVLGANLRSHDSDTACLFLYHMLPVPPAPVCLASRSTLELLLTSCICTSLISAEFFLDSTVECRIHDFPI